MEDLWGENLVSQILSMWRENNTLKFARNLAYYWIFWLRHLSVTLVPPNLLPYACATCFSSREMYTWVLTVSYMQYHTYKEYAVLTLTLTIMHILATLLNAVTCGVPRRPGKCICLQCNRWQFIWLYQSFVSWCCYFGKNWQFLKKYGINLSFLSISIYF